MSASPPPRASRSHAWLLGVAGLLLAVVVLGLAVSGIWQADRLPAYARGPVKGGRFTVGLVSNAGDARPIAASAARLGARIVRVEFGVGTSPDAMSSTIAAFDAQGITVLPLAGFEGTLPSAAQARNLAGWAAVFGPGGSAWRGDRSPHPIRWIEFGNETSFAHQYPRASGLGSLGARARSYAQRFSDAAQAIGGANAHVGLLAQGDDGNTRSSDWVDGMFDADPGLGGQAAGWTIHPYGPTPRAIDRINRMIGQLNAHGAAPTLRRPVFVTEDGIASDGGRCLSDNYGWPRCMSDQRAASALRDKVRAIHRRYGGLVRLYLIYEVRDLARPGATRSREDYFGAVRADGGGKGGFTSAVRSMLR